MSWKVYSRDGCIFCDAAMELLEGKGIKYEEIKVQGNKEAETLFKMKQKKPITASPKELVENLPSRSAKLRYVIKKDNFYNFDTDIFEKFKNLIEIENFGNKL